MLNPERMKEQAPKYQLSIDSYSKEVYLIKSSGDVQISTKRAIGWVNAGIDDLDRRSKEQMLEILKSWL